VPETGTDDAIIIAAGGIRKNPPVQILTAVRGEVPPWASKNTLQANNVVSIPTISDTEAGFQDSQAKLM
jgi:hypothetical protein